MVDVVVGEGEFVDVVDNVWDEKEEEEAVFEGLDGVGIVEGVALLLIAEELLEDEEGFSLGVLCIGVRDSAMDALIESED